MSSTNSDDQKHLLVATTKKLSREYRQLYGLLVGGPAPMYTVFRTEDSSSSGGNNEEDSNDNMPSATPSSSSLYGGSFFTTLASTVYNHSVSAVSYTMGGWAPRSAGGGGSAPHTNPSFYAPASLRSAVYLPFTRITSVEQFLYPMLLNLSKAHRHHRTATDKNSKNGGSFRKHLRKLRASLNALPSEDPKYDGKRAELRQELQSMTMSYASDTGVGQLAASLSCIDVFVSSFLAEVVPLLYVPSGVAGENPSADARVVPIREVTYEAAFSASEAVDAIIAEIDRRGSLINQLLLVCDHILSSDVTSAGSVSNDSGVLSYLGFKSQPSSAPAGGGGLSQTTSQFLFSLCAKGYTEELRTCCRSVLAKSGVEGGATMMTFLGMVKAAASAVVETGFDGLGVPTAPSFDNVFDCGESPTTFATFSGELSHSAGNIPTSTLRENGSEDKEEERVYHSQAEVAPQPPQKQRNKTPRKHQPTTSSSPSSSVSPQQPPATATTSAASTAAVAIKLPQQQQKRRPSYKEMRKVASSSTLPEGRRTAIEEQRVVLQDGTDATLFVEVPLDELDLHAEQQRHLEITEIARGMAEVNELQALINQHAVRQEEQLREIEGSATTAHMRAASGRIMLAKASRYQVVGAVVAGAVLGAAVGGPIGLLIGAKSAATVGGALAIGGVTGGVGAKVVTSASARNASTVDDDYEDRRERGEL